MPLLIDIIDDTFPANGDVGVPLASSITILFSIPMDHDRLQEDFFIEGPDTDQWIGPGLFELRNPDNISQGDLDDFLKSPGYRGIVQGAFTFKFIDVNNANLEVDPDTTAYRSKLIFTPTQPLYPLIVYTVNIVETLDVNGVVYLGHHTLSFDSGSGSITEIPSSISSSILSSGATSNTVVEGSTALGMVSSSPVDFSIDNAIDLSEISVVFNKDLDATTITNSTVTVETFSLSDHPNLTTSVKGKLAKELSVSGKTLTIKI